jgi:transposase
MELTARDRRRGSKNYTKEFREMVVGRANDCGRLIADVAQAHGLNANMVAKWRREDTRAQAPVPVAAHEAAFLAVQMTPPLRQPLAIVVERVAVRVRLEGTPDLDVLRTVLSVLREVQ